MKRIINHIFIVLVISGCGVYSFTGASISPEVKTISFQDFFNNSPLGPSNMSVLFNEKIKDYFERNTSLTIVDENGDLILSGDNDRRFFEAAWIHKYDKKYYLSYSTGDTHKIVYATGENPYGPFTYRGIILNPVLGWTNHHSIVKFKKKWYLFFHDSSMSGGKTHLRSVKFTELNHNEDGSIQTIDAMVNID